MSTVLDTDTIDVDAIDAEVELSDQHHGGHMIRQGENRVDSRTPSSLIALAVERDLDIDKLEKLLQLQREWERENARKAFFRALAKFQSEIPPIMRQDRVNAGAGGKRKFANLGTISEAIKPWLKENGLSFRFRQAQSDSGKITVTCVVSHQDGHSEETTLSAAPDTSGGKNAIQAVGSTMTYLERYTLIGGLGLTTVDEDDDGEAAAPPVEPTAPKKSAMELMKEQAAVAAADQSTQTVPAKETPTVPKLQTETSPTTTAEFDPNAPGTIAEAQRKDIESLFDRLGMTPEQREKAVTKRGGTVLRNLSQFWANDLLLALQNALAKQAALETAKAEAAAAEVAGKSRQQGTMQSEPLDGPCSEVQVKIAKSLLAEMEQRKPGTCQQFKAKLIASGKQKVSDCTSQECGRLLQDLGIQNLEDYFAAAIPF